MTTNPTDTENLAMLISLINQHEKSPTTGNFFRVIDFKDSISEKSKNLNEICPPSFIENNKDDFLDVNNNDNIIRLVLLSD